MSSGTELSGHAGPESWRPRSAVTRPSRGARTSPSPLGRRTRRSEPAVTSDFGPSIRSSPGVGPRRPSPAARGPRSSLVRRGGSRARASWHRRPDRPDHARGDGARLLRDRWWPAAAGVGRGPGGAATRALRAQVGGEGRRLALLEAHGDAKLLEVLGERPPAQLDSVGRKEGPHLRLPAGVDQPRHALVEPAIGARWVLPGHLLPVRLDELPGEAPAVDAPEHRADDVGRVLTADVAVERPLKGLLQQLGLAKAGERVEVSLLLLGAPGVLVPLEELGVV